LLDLKKYLLEKDIITKDDEKFYEISSNEKELATYFKRFYGWNLYKDRYIIKLDKIPSSPESYMGNNNFDTKDDYCIYIAFLIALESYSKGQQFKFKEIFNKLKSNLEKTMDISWEKPQYRKAVKRVFEYAEKKKLIVNEADKIINTNENNIEEVKVYYKKTNYCSPRYILNNLNNIFLFKNYEDFKSYDLEEAKNQPKNTLFRKLISKPVVYLSELTIQEKEILKNKKLMERFADEIEGDIHYHKNCIFLFFQDLQIGTIYPGKANTLDTMILVLNNTLREKVKRGEITLNFDDTFNLEKDNLTSLIKEYKRKNEDWLKYNSFFTRDDTALTREVIARMKEWSFLKEENDNLIFYPAIGKVTGELKEEIDVEENEGPKLF
jgi:hypothetical protein